MCTILLASASAFSVNQTVKATILSDKITIFSPLNGIIYQTRSILLNASLYQTVFLMSYIDNNKNPQQMCRNCNSYSRMRIFDDGPHTLLVKGDSNLGVIFGITNFIVDTKKPVIRQTTPKSGFANGNFTLEFQEVNPKEVFLTYGNGIEGYRNQSINLDSCEEINHYKNCKVSVDLSDFDQQKIGYYFGVIDVSNKRAYSKEKILPVDLSPPVINDFDYDIVKRQIKFFLDITEPNFDRIVYIDYSEKRPREINLCTSLKNGICDKKVYFKPGEHNLVILVKDKAGNVETIDVNLII